MMFAGSERVRAFWGGEGGLGRVREGVRWDQPMGLRPADPAGVRRRVRALTQNAFPSAPDTATNVNSAKATPSRRPKPHTRGRRKRARQSR